MPDLRSSLAPMIRKIPLQIWSIGESLKHFPCFVKGCQCGWGCICFPSLLYHFITACLVTSHFFQCTFLFELLQIFKWFFVVKQNISTGKLVMTVLASDGDDPSTPNGTFKFRLVSVTPKTENVEFYMNQYQNTGGIYFKGCLDYEVNAPHCSTVCSHLQHFTN